jgi:hypothetical protein
MASYSISRYNSSAILAKLPSDVLASAQQAYALAANSTASQALASNYFMAINVMLCENPHPSSEDLLFAESLATVGVHGAEDASEVQSTIRIGSDLFAI